jgi:hypothetical protein
MLSSGAPQIQVAMPRNASEEVQSVLKWIREQGYPLELRVSEVLRREGLLVSHAHWYSDPESKKPREIDLVALTAATSEAPKAMVGLAFVIECKVSSGKPWVVFSSEPSGMIRANPGVVDLLSRDVLTTALARRVIPPAFLQLQSRVGHGIARAYGEARSGDSIGPWSAVRGAVSAALGIGGANEEQTLQLGEHFYSFDVVVPVVVVEGSLYEYYLSGGRERIRKVRAIQLLAATHDAKSPALVQVVTFSGFRAWLRAVHPQGARFCSEVLPYVSDILRLTRSRQASRARSELDAPRA